MSPIGDKVLSVLEGIELTEPEVDRAVAAEHLRAYAEALGIERPDVRWFPDLEALRKARVWPGQDRAPWPSFTNRQWRLLDGMYGSTRRPVSPAPAREVARIDRQVIDAGLGAPQATRAVRRVVSDLVECGERLVAGMPPPRRVGALVPLAEAAAAGLFAFAVGAERDLVAVARPAIQTDEQGRPHNWDGEAAVSWPRGGGIYFWRGVRMTDAIGRNPEAATPPRIARWPNAERRRVAIERIGIETFLPRIGGTVLQQDDYGRLWRSERTIDGEPFVAVEVVNSTAEPDGSFRRYFLRVPPDTRTARAAVAWTFGQTVRAYTIAAES